MRLIILGATGCVGSHAISLLARLDGVEVIATSRSGRHGSTALDILDPSAVELLKDGDVVIDFADSLAAAPDPLIEGALQRRVLWVETSADGGLLERLHTRYRSRSDLAGTLVLGAGLFPGVSNLLAREVAGDSCECIEVAIRYRPLSRAGVGVCRLMAHALGHPATRYVDGEIHQDPPVVLGPELPFFGRRHPTLRVGLPETRLLHWSLGASTTATYLSPVPFGPVTLVRAALALTPWSCLRPAPMQTLTTAAIRVLRSVLLRPFGSAVCITAVADRDTPRERHASVAVDEGMEAAAAAGVAMALRLAGTLEEIRPGVHLIDEPLTLREVEETLAGLGCPLQRA